MDWMNLLVCEGAEREEQVAWKRASSQEESTFGCFYYLLELNNLQMLLDTVWALEYSEI